MLLEEFDPSLSINPTLPSINPSISQAVFSGGPVTVNVRSIPVAAVGQLYTGDRTNTALCVGGPPPAAAVLPKI